MAQHPAFQQFNVRLSTAAYDRLRDFQDATGLDFGPIIEATALVLFDTDAAADDAAHADLLERVHTAAIASQRARRSRS